MTSETQNWLETRVKVGFAEIRGNAWWYAGDPLSHFPGAIPEDVARQTLTVPIGTFPVYAGTGEEDVGNHRIPKRRAIMNTETDEVFYIGSDVFEIHDYPETLLDRTETIMDGKLGIASVGTLQGGARAFIQYEAPETREVAGTGERYRPFLVVTTGLDGQSATTWKYGFTRVVCDNTLDLIMGEQSRAYVEKHKGKRGEFSIQAAREALDLLDTVSDDFEAEVKRLIATPVSDKQWGKVLCAYSPIKPEDEVTASLDEKTNAVKGAKSRITRAETVREDLTKLWKHDTRVAPWTGTAWGVLQSVNTLNQHYRTVKEGTHRAERNMLNFFDGKTAQEDNGTLLIMEALGILPKTKSTVKV